VSRSVRKSEKGTGLRDFVVAVGGRKTLKIVILDLKSLRVTADISNDKKYSCSLPLVKICYIIKSK